MEFDTIDKINIESIFDLMGMDMQPVVDRVENADGYLMSLVQVGDENAFNSLVKRYERDLLYFLFRFMKEEHKARDVMQETWLQVFKSASTFDTSRKFKAWLFTIAANKARDSLRKKSNRPMAGFDANMRNDNADDKPANFYAITDDNTISSPADEAVDHEHIDLIYQQLAKLDKQYREIIQLRDLQECSYAEIAEILDIPEGTVKSRLFRARNELKALIRALLPAA